MYRSRNFILRFAYTYQHFFLAETFAILKKINFIILQPLEYFVIACKVQITCTKYWWGRNLDFELFRRVGGAGVAVDMWK